MSGPGRRAALEALNGFALVAASALVAATSSSATPACGADNNCDSRLFAAVAERLWTGASAYAPVPLPDGIELPFLYPPPSLPLFAAAWAAPAPVPLGAAATAIFVAVTARAHGALAATLAGLGGWTLFSAFLGQNGALVGAAAVAAGGGSGLALGALLLKPQLGVPLLAAAVGARGWRALLAPLALQAGLAALATALFGGGIWAQWVEALQRPWPELDAGFRSSPFSSPIPWILGIPLAWWSGRRTGGLSVAAALALALSPHTHPYDLSLWVLASLEPGKEAGVSPGRKMLLGLGLLTTACVVLGLRLPLKVAALAVGAWGLHRALRPPTPETFGGTGEGRPPLAAQL